MTKNEAINLLEEYRKLKNNWNGYGAKSPSNGLINQTIKFLDYIPENANYDIFPTAAESIQFEFEKSEIEIEVHEDGLLTIYNPKTKEIIEERGIL